MLVCNFIGIVFARTLHYQFYVWYQAALALLMWPQPGASWLQYWRVLPCLAAELVFNIYPPRPWAAYLLQAAHWSAVVAVYFDESFEDDQGNGKSNKGKKRTHKSKKASKNEQ